VSGPCTTDLQNPTRRTPCCCLQQLDLVDREVDQLFEYLLQYFKLPFTDQRRLILEWKRYAMSFRIDEVNTKYTKHQTYLLPGSSVHRICKSALAKLLVVVGKSRHAWNSITEYACPVHGLSLRKEANHAGHCALPTALQEKLNGYFQLLSQLGGPRATRLVARFSNHGTGAGGATKLRDDADVIELPACHSKRAIYWSFLQSQGWTTQYDHKGRQVSASGVEGEQVPINGPAFSNYWAKHWPRIVIQRPAEDNL
jgi:hypothetical protein